MKSQIFQILEIKCCKIHPKNWGFSDNKCLCIRCTAQTICPNLPNVWSNVMKMSENENISKTSVVFIIQPVKTKDAQFTKSPGSRGVKALTMRVLRVNNLIVCREFVSIAVKGKNVLSRWPSGLRHTPSDCEVILLFHTTVSWLLWFQNCLIHTSKQYACGHIWSCFLLGCNTGALLGPVSI